MVKRKNTPKLGNLNKKLKSASTLALNGVAKSLPSAAVDEALNIANIQVEKHKNDVKIPDIIGLSQSDAEYILKQSGFMCSSVLAEPNVAYATKTENAVVESSPRPNTTVSPNSFVKVYYVDKGVIEQSKQLILEANRKKKKRSESTRALFDKISTNTKKATKKVATKAIPSFLRKKHKTSQTPPPLTKEDDDNSTDSEM
jgi:beta-lactam-binding protein with PASTA domain